MCKYLNMFKAYGNDENGSELFAVHRVKSQIDWAKKTLRKEDKIIWYLRIYRFLILKANTSTYNQAMKMTERWVSVASAVEDCESLVSFSANATSFEHYMDLNIPDINNYVFGDKSIVDVFSDLEGFESVWQVKQERKSRAVEEYGKPFITVGKYTWFNLERGGCSLESTSMSHCGNGVSGRPGDVLYSLREPGDEPNTWIPHVTLVLKVDSAKWHAAGATTEIKGRFNNKPDVEFHDALVAFVLSDRVTEMRDGGYLAKNNFKLSDLSVEQRSKVKALKPQLFPFVEHLRDASGEVTGHLRTSLKKFEDDDHSGFIKITDNFNIFEFANEHDLTRLLAYRNLLVENYDLEEQELIDLRAMVKTCFDKMFLKSPYSFKLVFNFDESVFSMFLPMDDFLNATSQLDPNDKTFADIPDDEYSFQALVGVLAKEIMAEADKEDLFDSHDHLLESTDLHVLNKGVITDVCYKDVVNTFDRVEVASEFGPCKPFVTVFEGNLEELASQFDLTTLGNYQSTLIDGYSDLWDHTFDFDAIKDQIVEVWENKLTILDKQHLQTTIMNDDFKESTEYLLDDAGCLTTDSFISLLKDYIDDDGDDDGDDIKDGLSNAHRRADEVGAYDDMYKAAELSLDNLALELDAFIVRDGFESIKVNMSLEKFLDITRENIDNSIGLEYFNEDFDAFEDALSDTDSELGEHVSRDADLDKPYYGFFGFCSDTASYEVLEAMHEFIEATSVSVAA